MKTGFPPISAEGHGVPVTQDQRLDHRLRGVALQLAVDRPLGVARFRLDADRADEEVDAVGRARSASRW